MAGRSKTKERILKSALQLFNAEGEETVLPADIAHDLGISPGNLYYHYKGKEPIIEALYNDFEEELKMVLVAPRTAPLEIRDNWVYFYIVFEEIFDFRFFYLNLMPILDRIPSLAARFRALVKEKHRASRAILRQLRDEEVISLSEAQLDRVAAQVAQHFTHWPAHQRLMHPDLDPKTAIHDGVRSLFAAITPYMGAAAGEFEALSDAFNRKILDTESA